MLKNNTFLPRSENRENNIPSKHFTGPYSQPQPVVKKRALLGVENTLHQKCTQRINQASTAWTKTFSTENNGCKIHKNDEHKIATKIMFEQKEKTQSILLNDVLEYTDSPIKENVEPVCFCYENFEDDVDLMFKNITLTKSQIENLALEWENPHFLCVDDKRDLDLDFSDLDEGFIYDLKPDLNCSEVSMEFPEVAPVSYADDSGIENEY